MAVRASVKGRGSKVLSVQIFGVGGVKMELCSGPTGTGRDGTEAPAEASGAGPADDTPEVCYL